MGFPDQQKSWPVPSTSKMLTIAMNVHLIMEAPMPDMAPYLPAMLKHRQYANRNPIQLNRNPTVYAQRRDKC